MSQESRLEALIQYSNELANECEAVSTRLAKHADKVDFRREAARSISVAIGITAILVAYIPTFASSVGPSLSQALPAIAALTLIVGSSVFLFGAANSPERFRDYSNYLLHYYHRISEITACKDRIILEVKLHEINMLAQQHIRDARTKWPTLLKGARTTLIVDKCKNRMNILVAKLQSE